VTQAPLSVSGWAETPGLALKDENTCASGGWLGADVTPPGIPKAVSSWTFSAPVGTKIVAATLYREVDVANRAAKAFAASPENVEDAANEFDLCEAQGASGDETACERGNVFAYRECKATLLCPPLPYAPADTLVVPSSHLPAHQLAFDVICAQQGCSGYEHLRSADIVLEQSSGPTAIATGGTLTNASTLRGVADIEISGTDPASGVFQAILQADGKTIAKQVINTNGGSCEPYSEEPDGAYVFLNVLPCPQAVSNIDVPFNTEQIPDGPQQITVLVSDAAGNTATILSRNVMVENSGQYLIKVQQEQQEQALAALGPCNAGCDEHARLEASNTKLTTRTFTRPYKSSALDFAGRLFDHAGAPIKGATIELHQQANDLGSQSILISTTATNAKGEWQFTVAKGPSRVLTVGYRARSKDPNYATEIQYHERVLAGIHLVAPRRVFPGKTFTFRGSLAGNYVPPSGVLVSLEIYYGGKWREIALLRTKRNGHFSYGYAFAPLGAATYRFQVQVPYTIGYPFAPATSPTTYIHLRGE
jgi:hypothetical protein